MNNLSVQNQREYGHFNEIDLPDESGRTYRVPLGSLEHHLEELSAQLGGPPCGVAEIDAVLRGEATWLGRGHEGLVFAVGNRAVKVGTVTPYIKQNRSYRTPLEATQNTRQMVGTAQVLRIAGVEGLPDWTFVEHAGRGWALRELCAPVSGTPSKAVADQIEQTFWQLHRLGYVLRDRPQVGLVNDRAVIYDSGSLLHCDGQHFLDCADDDITAFERWSGRPAQRGYAVIRDALKMSSEAFFDRTVVPDKALELSALRELERGYLPKTRALLTERLSRGFTVRTGARS